MPLDLLQQLLTTVGFNVQVALGHMIGCLQVFPAPGVTKRSQVSQQVPSTQAVNHHQQMHRQRQQRSEEHTSELQSLMRISYAVFCLKKKKQNNNNTKDNLS